MSAVSGPRVRAALIALAVLLAGACDSGGASTHDSGDPSTRDGGGPSTDDGRAAPGELKLVVVTASWVEDGDWSTGDDRVGLALGISLDNGLDSTSVAPAPPLFTLETAEGSGVIGVPRGALGECPSDIFLLAGNRRECALFFEVPLAETPVRVRYQPQAELQATAEIPPCGPAADQGLCPLGELCVDGACQSACSSATPDGVCPGGEGCRNGSCVAPCSAAEPDGYCAEGACYQGACDSSCFAVHSSTDCILCAFQAAADIGVEPGSDCESCLQSCADTPSTCACIDQTSWCDFCPEANQLMSALVASCPMCVAD